MTRKKRKSTVKSSVRKKQKKKPASVPIAEISFKTPRVINASSSSSASRKSIATSSVITPDQKSPNGATASTNTIIYAKNLRSKSKTSSKTCASEPFASSTDETRTEPTSKVPTKRNTRETMKNDIASEEFPTEALLPSKNLLTKPRINTRSAVTQAKALITPVSKVPTRRSTRSAIAKSAATEQSITDTSGSSKSVGQSKESFTDHQAENEISVGRRWTKETRQVDKKTFPGIKTRSKTYSEAEKSTENLGSSSLKTSKPIQKTKWSELDTNSKQKMTNRLSRSKLIEESKITHLKPNRKSPNKSEKFSLFTKQKMQSVLDDNGRKSLDKLMNKLFPGVNTRSKTSSEAKTPTQKSGSSPLSSRSKLIRKDKKSKFDSNSNQKITKWLSKSKLVEENKLTQSKQKSKTPKSPSKLDITITKKTKTKLPRSNSFEKYGILMPSVEEMLEQHKKYEEHKKTVAAFDEIEDIDLEPSLLQENEKEEEPQIEILDCKHLTIEKLSEAFDDNLNYITEIFKGNRYSERHRRFHNYKVEYNNTTKDLTYNTSMIVFTDDQKLHLMSLMEKALDPENKHTKYFFQVLLPELCLKIFMDVHNMSKKQAAIYLDKRPIV